MPYSLGTNSCVKMGMEMNPSAEPTADAMKNQTESLPISIIFLRTGLHRQPDTKNPVCLQRRPGQPDYLPVHRLNVVYSPSFYITAGWAAIRCGEAVAAVSGLASTELLSTDDVKITAERTA